MKPPVRGLGQFSPTRLLAATAAVRELHPHTAEAFESPTNQLTARIRRELLFAGDDAGVNRLAKEYSPLELRAVVRVVAADKDAVIRARGGRVLLLRLRSDLMRDAWRQLVGFYPVPELEAFLRKAGSSYGWEDIGSTSYLANRLVTWFGAPDVLSGMLADSDSLGVANPDGWLTTVGVDPGTALGTAVWRSLLVEGSAAQLARIQPAQIVARGDASGTETRAGFARNYLEKLGGRDRWSELVLLWIRRIHGVPAAEGGQTPLWRSVSEPVRREFRRWAQEYALKEFFLRDGDTAGRFTFWSRYSGSWQDVTTALDNKVMIIDFGSFGVIEFADVGNAGYVYRQDHFNRVIAGVPRSVADYKDQALAIGRIIHTQNWEYRAASIVEHARRTT